MWLLLNLTTVQANTDHFNDFQKAIQQVKQEYHSHSEVGGGGGWASYQVFKKGGLAGPPFLEGGVAGTEGDAFFQRWDRGGGVKSFQQKIN